MKNSKAYANKFLFVTLNKVFKVEEHQKQAYESDDHTPPLNIPHCVNLALFHSPSPSIMDVEKV